MHFEKNHLPWNDYFGINFQSSGSNRIIEQGIEWFFTFKEIIESCGFSGDFLFPLHELMFVTMLCGSAFPL